MVATVAWDISMVVGRAHFEGGSLECMRRHNRHVLAS